MKNMQWRSRFWRFCLLAVTMIPMVIFVAPPQRTVEASSALLFIDTDLSISKTDSASAVDAGGSTTYTIRVTNTGFTVTGAILKDATAAGLTKTAVACSSTPGQCVAPAPTIAELQGSGFALPALADGEFYEIEVDATVTATSGTVTNTATIEAAIGDNDTNAGNNTASDTDTVTPVADLEISKDNGVSDVLPLGSTTYTITVTNNGPSSVTGAILEDAAATGLTKTAVVCSSTASNQCVTPPSVAELEGGSFALPALDSGEFYEIEVDANVTVSSGTVTNTATIAVPAGTTDDDNTNNSADDTDNVTPATETSTPTSTPTKTQTPTITPTATDNVFEDDIRVIVENDANGDGDYHDTETVYVKYVDVKYKVTITNKSDKTLYFVNFTDTKFHIGGTCEDMIGKKLEKNDTKTCTFKKDFSKGELPITNKTTVMMRDSGDDYGWDTDTSTVKYSSKTPTPTKTTYVYHYYTSTPWSIKTSTPTSTFDFNLASKTPTRTPTPSPARSLTPQVTSTRVSTATLRGGLSLLQMTGTYAAAELETVAALEDEVDETPSTGGFNFRLLLWCLFPAVLLLLIGSGLELYRWLKMRS